MPDDAPLIAVVVVAIQHFIIIHADGDLLSRAGFHCHSDVVEPVSCGISPFYLAGIVRKTIEPYTTASCDVVGDGSEFSFRQRCRTKGVDDEQFGRRSIQVGRGNLIQIEENVVAVRSHVVDEGSDSTGVRGDVVVPIVNYDERYLLVRGVKIQGCRVILRVIRSGRPDELRNYLGGSSFCGLPADVRKYICTGTHLAGWNCYWHRANWRTVDAEGNRQRLRGGAAIGYPRGKEVGIVDGWNGRLHGQIGNADIFHAHRPYWRGHYAVAICLRNHYEVVVYTWSDCT
ncbi:MAG: hypothetical protein BWY63_01721 [Chloroflexi bacterium ADurb.Bin360]|nr:MAG: hypothetical protein BWY63_01721 [Chloroflexi bacterium ADurb.Bin360]